MKTIQEILQYKINEIIQNSEEWDFDWLEKDAQKEVLKEILEKIAPIENAYIEKIKELEEKAKIYDSLSGYVSEFINEKLKEKLN